jgi:hypothetical protein
MANEFALKKLQQHGFVPKFAVTKTKKSKIKKFEDVYYVPLAYIGMAELRAHSPTKNYNREYSCNIPFSTEAGDGHVVIYMHIYNDNAYSYSNSDYDVYREMEDRFDRDPNDTEAETYLQNYNLRRENTSDVVNIKVTGAMKYYISGLLGAGTECVYNISLKERYDVQEALDQFAQSSETGWSKVMEKVNEALAGQEVFEQAGESLPTEISISTGFGDLLLKIDEVYYATYGAYMGEVMGVEDKVQADVSVILQPIKDDETRYEGQRYGRESSIRERSFTPKGYDISVIGRITDYNTQLSTGHEPKRESWTRDFGHEGASTLDEAKSIIGQNIKEIYDEWTAFVESERNYEREGHGRGRSATYENTAEWAWNYGDTKDDVNYEEFQDREMADRVESEVKSLVPELYRFVYISANDDYNDRGYSYFILNLRERSTDSDKVNAVKTILEMNGYQILDVLSGYGGYVNILFYPSVYKTKKMKKSIKQTYMNLVKSLSKTRNTTKAESSIKNKVANQRK